MARKANPALTTVRDVAKAAGVSPATASNVLSGRRQVTSAAGQRVLQCAEDLGYIRESHTEFKKVIHFVLYKKHGHVIMDTPFFSALIQGIEQTCRSNGFSLSITYIDCCNNENAEALTRQIAADTNTPLLLLATEMDEQDLAPFLNYQAPLVILDNICPTQMLDSVVMDNYMAGWIAGKHFLEMGHCNFGLITSSLPFQNSLDREEGFINALKSAGISLKAENIVAAEPMMDQATIDLKHFFSNGKRKLPSAFFAINDILAFAAFRALQECGYRIPEDVSLIGMDNLPFGCIVTPQLTTINVPKEELGCRAVARLIEMTKQHHPVSIKQTIGVSLIKRGSVQNLAGSNSPA